MNNTSTYTYDPKVAAIHKLRVNVKSLAAEAKIIRHEERRAGYQYQTELALHRRGRLREEARYAQLALAFLRGKPYISVECDKARKTVDYDRLANKVSRTGCEPTSNHRSAVTSWLNADRIMGG